MVRKIMNLAIRFDADIAIENLKRFKGKGRKFNKAVMRIPFFKFRQILASRCFDNNITLNIVDSWHTSEYCSHCGAVGKGHDRRNYALFRSECGVLVNSDRNASKNIAIKSLLEREHSLNTNAQISNRQGLINDLLPPYESGLSVAVQHSNHLDGKPTPFRGG
jgi:IS605 OrfB family transposase